MKADNALSIEIPETLYSSKSCPLKYIIKTIKISDGKRKVDFSLLLYQDNFSINILNHTPMTKAWRSIGKEFPNFYEAYGHYNSPQMRSLIKAAHHWALVESCSAWVNFASGRSESDNLKADIIGQYLFDQGYLCENPDYQGDQDLKYIYLGNEHDEMPKEYSIILDEML